MLSKKIESFLKSGILFFEDEERVKVGIGPLVWSSEQKDPGFYFPDFFLRSKAPWCYPREILCVKKCDLIGALKTSTGSVKPKLHFEKGDFSLYRRQFLDLQQQIFQKTLQKGVLYSFERAKGQLTPGEIAYLLEKILSISPRFFPYGFWEKGQGILGVTPEVLFDLKGQTLSTMALAGSMRDSSDRDPKIEQEQAIVAYGIKDNLSHLGDVFVGERKVKSFGGLYHLMTPITLQLKKETSLDLLVETLHPTGAIGGFPKAAARSWLTNLEQTLPRGRFGAPFACLKGGCFFCLVAIRNLQWQEGECFIGAGGGVIDGSHLEKEWEELTWKWQLIKRQLSIV